MRETPEMPEALPSADVATVAETAKENEAVLDVHVPHPTHTWKDFFIHIATITVGLLIAVGLEQTVEAIHHGHQRHQLEADLRAESVRNEGILALDLKLMEIKRGQTVALRDAVDARRRDAKAVRVELPPTNRDDLFLPSVGVWSSARDSSQLALLPRELTEMYEELYTQPQYVREDGNAWFSAGDSVRNFENQFTGRTASGHLDLTKLKAEELSEYSALLTRLITQNESLDSKLRFYARENGIVVRGAESDEEMQREMRAGK